MKSYILYIGTDDCIMYESKHDRYRNWGEDYTAYEAYLRSMACGIWPKERQAEAFSAFKATLTPPSL